MDKHFQTLCERAASLSPQIEQERRLPADFACEMAAANLFRLFAPKEVDGSEMPAPESLAMIEEMARHDAASGWVMMIGNTTSLAGAIMPPEIGQEIFGGEQKITCGIFAPNGVALKKGDDFVVNGRWQWASGSANADWIGLGCMVIDAADETPSPANMRLLFFRREQLILHDNWHTLGLAGSSSGDVEAKNVAVKCAYSYAPTDRPWADRPLYRLPNFSFLACGIAACALGNAAAAIADFDAFVAAKKMQGASRTLADTSRVQSAYARALAAFRAARHYLYTSVEDSWQQIVAGEKMSPQGRADLRLAATYTTRQAVQVVRDIHDLAGGTSVYKTSPIQRRLRDAETMTQHMMTGPATYDMIGRVLLTDDATGLQL